MTFVSKQIGSNTYAMRPLAPDKVLDHGFALMANVVAPGLKDVGASASVDSGAFLPVAIGALLARLNSPTVQSALKDIWKTATVNFEDGREVELEMMWKNHFIGKPGELAAFVAWAFTEQFKDFFGGAVAQIQDVGTQIASQLASKK